MRGSNSTVLDTVATAGSRSNLFAKLFTQCLQTCECVISSFNVLPKNSMGERFHSQTFANTTKKSNSMGSMGFVCCRKLALNIAFAFSSLVPFVFDAGVVLLIRHPFGNGPGKDLAKTTTSTTTTWCLGLRQLLCLGCARWWLWRLWRVSWAQFLRT